MIKVSILLPVYGAERFIERCAISLFEQTYDNIEFVFVNDCTKDRSIEILQEVVERYPHRKEQVRIINHEKNKGVGEARNTLLDAATGDFLLFVDPDDYVDTDLVERLVECQQKDDVDIVLYDYKIITKENTTTIKAREYATSQDYLLDLLRRTVAVGVWGKMIRRSLFTDNNIKVEGGINSSEDCLILVQAVYYSKSVSTCHDMFYYYDKRNEQSITNSFSSRKTKDDFAAFDYMQSFFKDKGLLDSAYQEGALNHYLIILENSALGNDEECFYEAQNRLMSLDNITLTRMSLSHKLLLKMNMQFAEIIIKAGRYAKLFFRNC